MNKVRIYDLSKELNLENKDILAICSQLNIAVKSHSSTISEEEASGIRNAATSYKPTASSATHPVRQVESRNQAPLNTPKKQQILQLRRSPDRPEGPANKPELVGPPTNQTKPPAPKPLEERPTEATLNAPNPPATEFKQPPVDANSPLTAPLRDVGSPETSIATSESESNIASANNSVASANTTASAAKLEAEALLAKPAIVKPAAIVPPGKPATGSEVVPPTHQPSEIGSEAIKPAEALPKGSESTPRTGTAKPAKPEFAPKPVLNKPPVVNKPVVKATPSPADRSIDKPGAPGKPGPAPKPGAPGGNRPQQIVELRRPKPVAEGGNKPVIAGKPQRPGVPNADGTVTGPAKPVVTTELLAKPTLPGKVKPKKPWEEEEEVDLDKKNAAKAKRRGPKIDDSEDDVDLVDDDDVDEDDDTLVSQEQISLSLARPPKPKGAPTAKPTAAVGQRRRPSGNSYRDRRDQRRNQQNQKQEKPEIVTLTRSVTVQELSQILVVSETEIIRNLFMKGIAATVTQTLDLTTATTVAEEMGILVDQAKEQSAAIKVTEMVEAGDLESLQRRPPVVTIMGHVDHGKTSLLDAIRKTKVAAGEAGGITQHIGAYHVDVEHNGTMQQVVFLDTPGHEAFTAMRARGARVTDVAILVVAADDGVQPQTVEAISHAKAAGVPIIVAINKVDKEAAQPDRVKQELTEYQLVPEEWGGSTVMVPVSAITGQNLDTLLEMILLVSEVEDLSANPDRMARGTVIEAHLDKAKGPVATLLVQNGTLHVGDILVAGSALGKVRAMVDDRLQRVKNATPSFAVEVLGLSDVPAAGDEFEVYKDEKEARAVATDRADAQRQSRLMAAISSRRVSLNTLSSKAQEGELKELNIVMKADVQGSVEALLGSLKQLPQNEVQVRVLFAAPGEISETDVDLAAASEAVLIGFNTTLATGARQAADRLGVDVREYNIIYALLDDIQAAMEGLLEPELVEEELGQVEVRVVFTVGKGAVAGCYIQSGKAIRNCKIRVRRKNNLVFEGNLDSLKRMKEDAREVNAGYECGIGVDNFNAWEDGDIIETFRLVTKRRTLSK